MKKQPTLEQYFHLLSSQIQHPIAVAIGVSGGPDSMFLAHVVLAYYDIMCRPRSLIHIIHFNHGQRKEARQEQKLVIDAFPDCYRYRNIVVPAVGLSETSLRNERHDFFKTVLEQERITHLLLGHNLTDRIETSLFNMVRGATHGGRKGMVPTQHHSSYTIMRPLLYRSKQHILAMCQSNAISYMIDSTNSIPNNPRNILRNRIIPDICALHTGGLQSWEASRSALYAKEAKEQQPALVKVNWLHHTPHHSWRATAWNSIPLHVLTHEHIWMLVKGKQQITYADVQKLRIALVAGNKTHHISRGYHFFVVSGVLHCIQTEHRMFRSDVDMSKPIKRSGLLQFDGNIYSIPPERVGCTLRYPLAKDVYKGKPLRKVLTNKKIPIFMRSTTPVVVSDGAIIAILS